MLEDCQTYNLEIILTKSISRFGRDTVDTLGALNQLKTLGVRVIFEQESLDTADTDTDLMVSIIEAIAQAENESRSENIKWGIKQRAAQGTSKLYNRKCYGYVHDKEGNLIIKDNEVENVTKIFEMYLNGKSVIGIVTELENLGVKSPTGKNKWSKRTIDVMLSNEKYTGSVRLLDNGKHDINKLACGKLSEYHYKHFKEQLSREDFKLNCIVEEELGDVRGKKYYIYNVTLGQIKFT